MASSSVEASLPNFYPPFIHPVPEIFHALLNKSLLVHQPVALLTDCFEEIKRKNDYGGRRTNLLFLLVFAFSIAQPRSHTGGRPTPLPCNSRTSGIFWGSGLSLASCNPSQTLKSSRERACCLLRLLRLTRMH